MNTTKRLVVKIPKPKPLVCACSKPKKADRATCTACALFGPLDVKKVKP